MEIKRFEFNFFGENTYLIWDRTTGEAAAVDPGMVNGAEVRRFEDFIAEKGLKLKYILLTHAHVDHTFGVDTLVEKYGVPVLGHKADLPLAQMRGEQARQFGLPITLGALDFDRFVSDGEILSLGAEEIKVIATPGHSLGGVCYYVPESAFVLTGDTLFQGSVGRTDLPGGNASTLIQSIRRRILCLPADTKVYPGHGPATTIQNEAENNPFL